MTSKIIFSENNLLSKIGDNPISNDHNFRSDVDVPEDTINPRSDKAISEEAFANSLVKNIDVFGNSPPISGDTTGELSDKIRWISSKVISCVQGINFHHKHYLLAPNNILEMSITILLTLQLNRVFLSDLTKKQQENLKHILESTTVYITDLRYNLDSMSNKDKLQFTRNLLFYNMLLFGINEI